MVYLKCCETNVFLNATEWLLLNNPVVKVTFNIKPVLKCKTNISTGTTNTIKNI